MSSVEGKLHFGLNQNTSVDSIEVIWPNNEVIKIIDPSINTTITVQYQSGGDLYDYNKEDTQHKIFNTENLIDYVHKEDDYNDFAEEKLIPYKVSTLGPAVAIGDVNKNGFNDIYIGNSAGKSAQLLINTGVNFVTSNQPYLLEDADFEDNNAVFFDANNNGNLDLYVASGANKNPGYQNDRLYINKNGVLTKAETNIPKNQWVTSVVVPYDYDNDGDVDLFVGNYTDLRNFGKTVESYILVNDGNGHFTKDENFTLSGKVTDAIWYDVNDNGQKDLLVTTEWDRPYIFMNQNGKLIEKKLPNQLSGLWQTLFMFDLNKDGRKDLLLGNWGLNTKFNLNFEEPLIMYHADFEKNGKEHTILAYHKNGAYYPLNTKDELSSQMYSISKKFVNHKSFAGKSIEEVFTKETLNNANKFQVETLASGYILNNNGNFNQFVPFPKDFQLAPINSFKALEIQDEEYFMLGGNSLKTNTYHGNYTSLKGLLVKDLNEFNHVSKFGVDAFNSQIKKIESIPMKDHDLLIIVSNNDKLKSYSY